NFIVDGQETNPGTGGGFRLDRDEAIQLQKKAVALAEHYNDLARRTNRLKQMETPADVQPCNAFTQTMTKSWDAGHSNTEQLRELWKTLAEKLGTMLGIYEEQDEQSGKDIKQSGGQDSGGGYLG
ncbi:Excreted virulence factor EspC, type VII ESX diderm, partial [Prauserella aidingensis]|uniref:type VII secretion target n=1 Tax=Prauserella aidingensis TaxID=387890 RepID=UPI0020A61C0F